MRVYAANKIKKKLKKGAASIILPAEPTAALLPILMCLFFAFDQPASPPDAFIETLEQHVIYQTRDSNYGKKEANSSQRATED